MAIIDTSVYIALNNQQEIGHAASWRWMQRMIAHREPVSAPAIILAEVGAALSRGFGDAALAREVVAELESSPLIEVVPVTLDLAISAAEIAIVHRIRGCDALFVALAQMRNDSLCTLDRQQLERGAAVISTYAPE